MEEPGQTYESSDAPRLIVPAHEFGMVVSNRGSGEIYISKSVLLNWMTKTAEANDKLGNVNEAHLARMMRDQLETLSR